MEKMKLKLFLNEKHLKKTLVVKYGYYWI